MFNLISERRKERKKNKKRKEVIKNERKKSVKKVGDYQEQRSIYYYTRNEKAKASNDLALPIVLQQRDSRNKESK